MSYLGDFRAPPVLSAAPRGDGQAAAELLPLVYAELHDLARARLARQPPGQTLQPTALVNEAWLRLSGLERIDWQDRAHFVRMAARLMREILVDHARRRDAAKRDGGQRITLTGLDVAAEEAGLDVMALDSALARLEGMTRRSQGSGPLRAFRAIFRTIAKHRFRWGNMFSTKLAGGLAGLILLSSTTPTAAQTAPAETRNDYSKPETWLCWPGRADACAIDNTATIASADRTPAFRSSCGPPIEKAMWAFGRRVRPRHRIGKSPRAQPSLTEQTKSSNCPPAIALRISAIRRW